MVDISSKMATALPPFLYSMNEGTGQPKQSNQIYHTSITG